MLPHVHLQLRYLTVRTQLVERQVLQLLQELSGPPLCLPPLGPYAIGSTCQRRPSGRRLPGRRPLGLLILHSCPNPRSAGGGQTLNSCNQMQAARERAHLGNHVHSGVHFGSGRSVAAIPPCFTCAGTPIDRGSITALLACIAQEHRGRFTCSLADGVARWRQQHVVPASICKPVRGVDKRLRPLLVAR